MKETVITVLTPTYNRCECLKKLYGSLIEQTNKNFIWIIVDDGSNDNTGEFIKQIEDKVPFKLEYLKKENGGKHTALNYAYQYIKTPLTFIVDSDDTLTQDAIDIVEATYEKYKNYKELCGFSFLRGKPDGGLLSSSGVPYDGLIESYCECRINRNIQGDMAEVWYTRCLKEYPFPEFKGERFLGEDIIWIKLAQKYKLMFFNKIVYISDYQNDGLTLNRRKHNILSPRGNVERALTFLDANIRNKYKFKAMLQYIIYGKFAGMNSREMYRKVKQKIAYVLLYPMAYLLYLKWKRCIN